MCVCACVRVCACVHVCVWVGGVQYVSMCTYSYGVGYEPLQLAHIRSTALTGIHDEITAYRTVINHDI